MSFDKNKKKSAWAKDKDAPPPPPPSWDQGQAPPAHADPPPGPRDWDGGLSSTGAWDLDNTSGPMYSNTAHSPAVQFCLNNKEAIQAAQSSPTQTPVFRDECNLCGLYYKPCMFVAKQTDEWGKLCRWCKSFDQNISLMQPYQIREQNEAFSVHLHMTCNTPAKTCKTRNEAVLRLPGQQAAAPGTVASVPGATPADAPDPADDSATSSATGSGSGLSKSQKKKLRKKKRDEAGGPLGGS